MRGASVVPSSRVRFSSVTTLLCALVAVAGCAPEACAPGNLARDADAGVLFPLGCYRACESDDQCASQWEICNRGRCRINPDVTYCADLSTSANARGDREDCDAYVCDQGTGLCKRNCVTTEDCMPAYVCSTDINVCVPGQSAGAPKGAFVQATPMHDTANCVRACTAASDCEDNEICTGGECMLRSNFCDGSVLTDGTADFRTDCAPYACNPVQGRCFGSCRVSDECTPGNSCCGNPTFRCASSGDQCD
jgi:hypothetical protein